MRRRAEYGSRRRGVLLSRAWLLPVPGRHRGDMPPRLASGLGREARDGLAGRRQGALGDEDGDELTEQRKGRVRAPLTIRLHALQRRLGQGGRDHPAFGDRRFVQREPFCRRPPRSSVRRAGPSVPSTWCGGRPCRQRGRVWPFRRSDPRGRDRSRSRDRASAAWSSTGRVAPGKARCRRWRSRHGLRRDAPIADSL